MGLLYAGEERRWKEEGNSIGLKMTSMQATTELLLPLHSAKFVLDHYIGLILTSLKSASLL